MNLIKFHSKKFTVNKQVENNAHINEQFSRVKSLFDFTKYVTIIFQKFNNSDDEEDNDENDDAL